MSTLCSLWRKGIQIHFQVQMKAFLVLHISEIYIRASCCTISYCYICSKNLRKYMLEFVFQWSLISGLCWANLMSFWHTDVVSDERGCVVSVTWSWYAFFVFICERMQENKLILWSVVIVSQKTRERIELSIFIRTNRIIAECFGIILWTIMFFDRNRTNIFMLFQNASMQLDHTFGRA